MSVSVLCLVSLWDDVGNCLFVCFGGKNHQKSQNTEEDNPFAGKQRRFFFRRLCVAFFSVINFCLLLSSALLFLREGKISWTVHVGRGERVPWVGLSFIRCDIQQIESHLIISSLPVSACRLFFSRSSPTSLRKKLTDDPRRGNNLHLLFPRFAPPFLLLLVISIGRQSRKRKKKNRRISGCGAVRGFFDRPDKHARSLPIEPSE